MTPTKPRKAGRYTLLERIAEGGSAEVFRGLEDRGHGIQRLVAVKVMHWELAEDTSLIKLFREETKVSLGLNHPNIVQTFDFGEDEDGRPFIVFEYVHGRTLYSLLDRLSIREARLPVEFSAFIAEQASRALQYAHAYEEPLTGRTLNIVHRDLSPHNLMISYEGVPKLIDFGIAKIVQEKDKTQTGFIKGKPAYLSPEQVNGDPLDGRSDTFTLGIVLWEALTGRKLFAGGTALSIMERIASKAFEIVAPSTLNPDVSGELDQIVLKALARDRTARPSAGELQGLLYKLIGEKNRDTYFAEISSLLSALFGSEIAQEKAVIRRLSEEVEEMTGTQVTDPSWLVPHPRPHANADHTKSDIVSALREVQELPPVVETSDVIELETRSEILVVQPKTPESEKPAPIPPAPLAPEKPMQAKPPPTRSRGAVTVPERYVPPRTIFQAALPVENEFTERYGSRKTSFLKAASLGLGFSVVVAGAMLVFTRSGPKDEKRLVPANSLASPAPAAVAATPSPRKPARAKKPVKPRHKRVFR